MSNSAWCDINSEGDTLKSHDISHNPKCKCRKQFMFSPRQFQLEVAGFKSTMREIFEGPEKFGKISFSLD